MPYFVEPLAFFGALALPGLLAIYWLRSRFQKVPVSSLMLWMDHKSPREGGVRVQNLQVPLLLILELLAITLLVLAATRPHVEATWNGGPIAVVLDDSFSMHAGGGDSSRERGEAEVLRVLGRQASGAMGHFSVRLILAGERAQLLGDNVHTIAEVRDLLSRWRCRASRAEIEKGIAMAGEVAGNGTRILVISDQAAPLGLEGGRIEWHGVGRMQPNIAIINAVRSIHDRRERCLVEIANYSASTRSTRLVIRGRNEESPRHEADVRLASGETMRTIINLEAGAPALEISISDDALDTDNHAILLSPVAPAIRVQLRIADAPLKAAILQALQSTDAAEIVAARADLIISDDPNLSVPGEKTWVVHLMNLPEAVSFLGPFVADKSHPLTRGLSFAGVAWAASREDIPGHPILLAGNTVLASVRKVRGARNDVYLNFRLGISTVQLRPDWPVFFWNLMKWRQSGVPGFDASNVRLGTKVHLQLPEGVENVRWIDPEGGEIELSVHERRVQVQAGQVGEFRALTVEETPREFRCSVNALQPEESDLSGSATGTQGRWIDDPMLRMYYADISWIFLVAALAILIVHMFLISRSSAGGKLTT